MMCKKRMATWMTSRLLSLETRRQEMKAERQPLPHHCLLLGRQRTEAEIWQDLDLKTLTDERRSRLVLAVRGGAGR
jgi:hypothetical protein